MAKNMLGMDLVEWKNLAGLSDPYSLELTRISAEAGVPEVLDEAERVSGAVPKPFTPKEKRLAQIKQRHRALRKGEKPDPMQVKALGKQLQGMLRKKGMGEDVSYDDLFEAYLEDSGLPASEFHRLLNIALENGDDELAAELMALEDQFDEVLGAIAKGAGAVGKAALKGAQAVGKGLKAVGKKTVGGFKSGLQKAAQSGRAQAQKSFSTPSSASPEPSSDAPKPSSTPSTATPTQKKKKSGGAFARLGKGIGQLTKGLGGLPGGAAASVGRAAKGVARGYKGEDVDAWEDFLENEVGITVDEYLAVCEEALEEGDEDMIETLHFLDEVFGRLLRGKKKVRMASPEQWQKARDVVSKYGRDTTKAASVRGRQVGQPNAPGGKRKMVGGGTTANEAVKEQMRLAGYADDYVEARSKSQQDLGQAAVAHSPSKDRSGGKPRPGYVSPDRRWGKDTETSYKLMKSDPSEKKKVRRVVRDRGQDSLAAKERSKAQDPKRFAMRRRQQARMAKRF